MELKPFYHEASVALSEDFTLQMVVDISVVDQLERLLNSNMEDIIADMFKSVTTMTKVLWGVTRPKHEDLSMGQIAGILRPSDPAKVELAHSVGVTLGKLIQEAFLAELNVEPPKKPVRKRQRG